MGYNENKIGFQKTDTSFQSAEDLKPTAATVRAKVLLLLKSIGPLTSEEIASELKMDYRTIQPRTSELRNEEKIEDSGFRKEGKFGKMIIVWKACDAVQ